MDESTSRMEMMGGLTGAGEGGKNVRGNDKTVTSLEVVFTSVRKTCMKNDAVLFKKFL